MKRRPLIALLTLLVSTGLHPAHAEPEPFAHVEVLLLQPEAELRARVQGEALSRYVLALQASARQSLAAQFSRRPNAGFVVVGLRPGHAPRAWQDWDQPLPAAQSQPLRQALEATPAPEVHGGTVLVTLKASLWGGRVSSRKAPSPPEWRAAAQRAGEKLEVSRLAELAWND